MRRAGRGAKSAAPRPTAQLRRGYRANHAAAGPDRLENEAERAATAAAAGRSDAGSGLSHASAAKLAVPASPGRPLDRPRRRLEAAFGADLGGVRVHADPEASARARHLGAEAFTAGRDIFFVDGAYRPDAPDGFRLLAHEIAHALQQASVRDWAGHRIVEDVVGTGPPQRAGPPLERPGLIKRSAAPEPSPRTPDDPAAVVALARRDPRVALPHAAAMCERFGTALEGIEVHIGPHSREACSLVAAKAFAAGHVIAFSETAPGQARVAHEVAHVVQQCSLAGTADTALAPGVLRAMPAGGQPEREAEVFAKGGSTRYLSSAKCGLYRDDGKAGEDEGDSATKTELRLKELAAKADFRLKPWKDTKTARFGAKGKSGRWLQKFKVSSHEIWQMKNLLDVTYDAETARLKKTKKKLPPKDEYKTRVSHYIKNIFANDHTFGRAGFVLGTQRHRISKVGEKTEVDYLSYIFLGETFSGTEKYYPVVQDQDAKIEKETDYAKVITEGYRGIVEKLTKEAKGHVRLIDIEKVKAPIDEVQKALDGDLTRPSDDDDDEPEAMNLEAKAKEIRDLLVDCVVNSYTKLPLLHNHVVQSRAFDGYEGIQGNILARWVSSRYKGKEFDPATQPIFDFTEAQVAKYEFLKKVRLGDGVIKPDKGDKYIIAESKAYAEIPSGEEVKGPSGDAIDQVQSYAFIIRTPIFGWWYEASDKSEQPAKATVKEARFKSVHYFFSSAKVAQAWQPVLRQHLQGIFSSTPDPKKPKKFEVPIKSNPVFKFLIEDGDVLEQKLGRDVLAKIKHPGITFKAVDLKLLTQREPDLAAGSLVLDVDMKGAATQTDVKKTIEPIATGSTETPTEKKRDAVGRIPGKTEGLKSKLDDILKRIKTDARLTDAGLEATLTVTDGPSAVRGLDLVGTELQGTFGKDQKFRLKGKLGIVHSSKKFKAELALEYDGENWNFGGKATVSKLLEGLKDFTIDVKYTGKDENLVIKCPKLQYERTFKGIKLSGTVDDVGYDKDSATFSAQKVGLKADLGAFGTADASARIERNELVEATLTYATPHIKYPKKNPILEGDLTGSVTYDRGKFGGKIGGTAMLKVAALEKLSKDATKLGLAVDVTVGEDGTYSGSIRTIEPIALGKHFRIPRIEANLAEDGSIAADFALEIVKVKYLDSARVDCRIDGNGFSVTPADVMVRFGEEGKSRIWGKIGATYAAGGFGIEGEVSVKIKEGLIGRGTLRYNTETNNVAVGLSVNEITLLKYGPKQHKLLDYKKQIDLVPPNIVGLYLDAGFELTFEYSFDLRVRPWVQLQDLSLETFDFESATATVELLGQLLARLIATPYVGLGLFALSKYLLRGGGGIRVPIAGEAKVKPAGKFTVVYLADGGVKGAARIGLVLTFGVSGSIRPYAEFSILDGAYEPKWEGDALTSFVILPERELFTYVVDFGAPLEKEESPRIPTEAGEAKKPAAEQQVKTDRGAENDTPVQAKKDAVGTDAKPSAKTASNEKGFNFKSLIDKLLSGPSFSGIKDLIDTAAEVWEAFAGAVGAIISFFRNWFSGAIDLVTKALRGIKKNGLVGFLKVVLKEKMGAELYNIVEPLLDALGGFEKAIMGLLEKPIPDGVFGFIKWVFEIIKDLVSAGWNSIVGVAKALGEVYHRAKSAFVRYVDKLIQLGRIGVKQSTYSGPFGSTDVADTYKILLPGLGELRGEASEGAFVLNSDTAIGYPLWKILRFIGATPTNDRGDYWHY
jgi:hypothetical protein